MDPFSVAAGVVGVLDSGIRLASGLRSLIETWRASVPEILSLHNEVADLNVILHRTEAARLGVLLTATKQDAVFAEALMDHLQQAESHLLAIEKLVAHVRSLVGSRRRFEWLRQKSRAERMKRDLRRVRVRINDLLLAHNM